MDALVVDNLKLKFIEDFNKFRKQLYKGYKTQYSILLAEIAIIENSDYFDINIYEYLMGL